MTILQYKKSSFCYNVPFSSLRFFSRHIRDFLRNTLFLRFANRSVRNLVLPFFLLAFVLFWQDVSSFCPIRHYFLLGDKNSIPYHVADSHAAAFSTGSLSLRYTTLLLLMIVYDICFYFRMERILWLLPIVRLSNHFLNLLLDTLFSYLLLYHFFAMNTSSKEKVLSAVQGVLFYSIRIQLDDFLWNML